MKVDYKNGEGPMPNTWKKFVPWALSPSRVIPFIVSVLICTLVALFAKYSMIFAIVEGVVFLWVVERVKEKSFMTRH